MTRTTAREIAIHFNYQLSFSQWNARQLLEALFTREYFLSLAEEEELYQEFPNAKQQQYITALVEGVGEHGAELDNYIETYALGWKFSRISPLVSAILRTAMYEVLYMPEVPNAAAINDAMEIARHYEDEDTVKFINGILGSFTRGETIPDNSPGERE